MNDFIASGQYDGIQGIWTSGMDGEVVEAIKAAEKPYVPIVGTDRALFVEPMLDPAGYPDLEGAAVTNTAAVGGAGVNLAVKLLNGEQVQTDASAPKPNTVLLVPVVADNLTDEGKATLQSWLVEGLDPLWPLGLTIEGWTSYTPEQAIPPVGCKGPGE
jgi:ribose transport system substrate-binding protein